mgnify:CR=1 FL=1
MATLVQQPAATTIKPLAEYDMSPERGYLCRHDAGAVTLPDACGDAAKVAMQMPDVLPSGEIRAFLKANLPAPESLSDAGRTALSAQPTLTYCLSHGLVR